MKSAAELKLFFLLLGLSALGLAASTPFLLFALSGIRVQVRVSPAALLAAELMQAFALSAVAAFAGVRLARRAGFDAPWFCALAEGVAPPPGFGAIAARAAFLGVVTAAGTVAALRALRCSVSTPGLDVQRASISTLVSSAFYGGIVEETIFRWGLLTAVVVAVRKLGSRDGFWVANTVVSLVFAAGHLPAASVLGSPLTASAAGCTVLGNGVPSLLFGWLFRRWGFETAIVTHGAADVCLQALLRLSA
jgi:membrane protease YdiL (CAAX protease family)